MFKQCFGPSKVIGLSLSHITHPSFVGELDRQEDIWTASRHQLNSISETKIILLTIFSELPSLIVDFAVMIELIEDNSKQP